MVRFETSTYYKQGNTIIGAEVIVSAETGEEIGSITVLSKTDYDDFLERFENLSSEFVSLGDDPELAGQTIADILENASEYLEINATSLGGLASDKFSKTSHTHSKQSITDLYDYDISLSKYNAGLNETINVTVKVTNQRGNGVANAPITILLDGANWKSGRTNSSGIFQTSYSANNFGLVTFSVNNQKIQCNINQDTGWQVVPLTNNNFYGWLHMRTINGVAYFRGDVRPRVNVNSARNTIAWIDSSMAPGMDQAFPVQGALNKFTLNLVVHTNGEIIFENHSETKNLNIIQGTWLPISATYAIG